MQRGNLVMKLGKLLLLLLIFMVSVFVLLDYVEGEQPATSTEPSQNGAKELEVIHSNEEGTDQVVNTEVNVNGSLFKIIGRTTDEVIREFGQPIRKDETPYGYTWWIYKAEGQYFQIGVEDKKVVTLYSIGPKVSIEPLLIGQPYTDVLKNLPITKEVNVTSALGSYQFLLTEEDIVQRPLVPLGENLYMQLYFDHFTERLSSVRLLTANVLLKHRPYEVYYRGELPDNPLILSKDWARIEEGMEKQIFDITNMIRNRFEHQQLGWDQKIASVAFQHSKDMAEHNYFSHISPEGKGLQERLKDHKVYYFSAGENIAAQYPDAPAAVEGWLNSEGHREALLNKDYTHLGVGVYRDYYTQNFLEKP